MKLTAEPEFIHVLTTVCKLTLGPTRESDSSDLVRVGTERMMRCLWAEHDLAPEIDCTTLGVGWFAEQGLGNLDLTINVVCGRNGTLCRCGAGWGVDDQAASHDG